jgi:hypothetical protein
VRDGFSQLASYPDPSKFAGIALDGIVGLSIVVVSFDERCQVAVLEHVSCPALLRVVFCPDENWKASRRAG